MTKNDKQRTVQEKIATLETEVAWFSSDEFVLEQAVERFKTLSALSDEITNDLAVLKNDVEIVRQQFDAQKSD